MFTKDSNIFDFTIPTWQELGTQVFFGILLGMFLGTLIGVLVTL